MFYVVPASNKEAIKLEKKFEAVQSGFTVGTIENTAIFILVVSSAVPLHDVSARASDVSMGIAIFPTG